MSEASGTAAQESAFLFFGGGGVVSGAMASSSLTILVFSTLPTHSLSLTFLFAHPPTQTQTQMGIKGAFPLEFVQYFQM